MSREVEKEGRERGKKGEAGGGERKVVHRPSSIIQSSFSGFRLGLLLTHPIQYYAPWFRYLARRLDIQVFYAHRQDAKGQAEAGFGVEFEWDVPLLDGYPYRFLRNVPRRPRVGPFNGCDTPEIYDILRRERFDAFLIFGWNYRSAIQAIRACWRNNVPVLMRGDSQLRTKRSWIKSAVKHFPYRWFLPRVDAHLYVGRRNKEYLRHYGVPEERLFFAPHFVDNAFFSARARDAVRAGKHLEFRDEFGIPHNAYVVMFVGKFIPKKRPADFIRASLRVFRSPEGANVHALLVGNGPLHDELEVLAQSQAKRIHFAGFRNQSELPAVYSAADVLVLPSDGRETWGLAVNEAMACGIPAVVSDAVGCAPDLIEQGKTGYTYPLGDVDALAQRMLSMLRVVRESEPAKVRQALAEKMACYSVERATEGLKEAIEAVAGK